MAIVPLDQRKRNYSHAGQAVRERPLGNRQVEEQLLGLLLTYPDEFPTLRATLQPDDFWVNNHRAIFAAMGTLYDNGQIPDEAMVIDYALAHRLFPDESASAIVAPLSTRALDAQPHALMSYAGVVLEHSMYRRSLALFQKWGTALADPDTRSIEALRQAIAGLQEAERGMGRADGLRSKRSFTARELMGTELPAPEWIVDGLLSEGVSILAGSPKLGKSWLVLNLAISVALGCEALGYTSTSQGDVLYLALEDTKRRLKNRMQQVLDGESVPERLHFQTELDRLDAGGLEEIERWIAEVEAPRLIIVDTLAKVRPDSTNGGNTLYTDDYAVMSTLKSLADRHHLAIVAIHHTRKASSDDPLEEISGTFGLSGAADTSLTLKRERGQTDATLHITGRDVDEAALALSFDATRGHWSIKGDAQRVKLGKTKQAIYDFLRQAARPCNPKEIAEATGISASNVKTTVWRMNQERVLLVDEHGKYSPASPSASGYNFGDVTL